MTALNRPAKLFQLKVPRVAQPVGDGTPRSYLVESARYTIDGDMSMIRRKGYLWWVEINSQGLERVVFRRINGWARGRGAIR
jgi:hypothetical protein